MTLVLRIENYDRLENGGPVSLTLNQRGAQIGRGGSMDWVLPDASRHVSSHHFDIHFESGDYLLQDVSTNGTYLQGQSHRIEGRHPLRSGDRLTVGQYIIRAEMPQPAAAPGLAPNPAPMAATGQASAPPQSAPPASGGGWDDDDIWGNIGGSAPAAPAPAPAAPAPASAAPAPAAPSPAAPAPLAPAPSRPSAISAPPAGYGGASNPPSIPAPPVSQSPAPMPAAPRPSAAPPRPDQGLQRPPSAGGLQSAPPIAPPMSMPRAPGGGLQQPPGASGLQQPPRGSAPQPGEISRPPALSQRPQPGPASNSGGLSLPPSQGAAGSPPAAVPMPSAHSLPPTPAAAPSWTQVPQGAAPAAAPASAPAAPGGASGDAVLRAFCAGAGLRLEDYPGASAEQIAGELGKAMRSTATEIMTMLRDRSDVKVFTKGGERTMRSATGNNPLKFLPDPQQVVEAMFMKPRDGFTSGSEAITLALSDIRKHQTAIFAALQPALANLLSGLSPDEVAEAGGSGGLLGGNKGRNWERYVELWDAKAAQGENGMLDVFLKGFSTAYASAIGKADN